MSPKGAWASVPPFEGANGMQIPPEELNKVMFNYLVFSPGCFEDKDGELKYRWLSPPPNPTSFSLRLVAVA
jgi:hypothetical protein